MNFILGFFLVAVLRIFGVASQDQPDCPHFNHTMAFFEFHNSDNKSETFCQQPFKTMLESCIVFYQKLKSKKVETQYKIVRNESTVSTKCEERKMTFWRPDNSSTEPDGRTKVTLDVQMFTCPLTKMDLKFSGTNIDLELEDYYLATGRNSLEFGVLRNSKTSSNICLTNLFRVKLKGQLDEMLKKGATTPAGKL